MSSVSPEQAAHWLAEMEQQMRSESRHVYADSIRTTLIRLDALDKLVGSMRQALDQEHAWSVEAIERYTAVYGHAPG